MDSAYAWKQYYAAERARLGKRALAAMLERAQPLELQPGRAIVIPHTRLEVTGGQIAAAVATVLASGIDRVLALGVLHGARRVDRDRVSAARNGNDASRVELRGVHHEDGLASEEFSLDAFVEMMAMAAENSGRRIEVVRRYPFLVGDDPATLPGIHDLERLVAAGALLVATTDPMHHGHAYGTPTVECLDEHDPTTDTAARAAIDEQLAALADHRYTDFARLAEQHRSDFKDTGPVLAHLVAPGFAPTIHDLALVDYADALAAPSPTWVAGALITV